MKKNKLDTYINIFSIILLALGFYLIFRQGDWSKVTGIKENIKYQGLVIVLFLFIICQFLVIFRWFLLLIPIKKGITLKSIFSIAISSILLNQTAPGKVGYPTKAYFLKKKEDIPISSAVPSVFLELFLDYSITGIFFLITALIGGYFKTIMNLLTRYIDWHSIWIIPVSIILPGLILVILKRRLQSINIFKNIITAFHLTRQRVDMIFWSIVTTFVYLFLWFICDYLLLISMGFKVPLHFLIFVAAFTNILVLLSPLPGGIGLREITGAYLFKMFYNLGEVAVIMILLNRLFSYLTLFILYLSIRFIQVIGLKKEIVDQIPDPIITGHLSDTATLQKNR